MGASNSQSTPHPSPHPPADERPTPRIIGLTGGIAMGKTTVSRYLAETHKLPVLDADVYARDAVEPGTSVWQKLVDRYGMSILFPDGRLDRVRLGDIIFNSQAERHWLERQIHPYVRDRFEAMLQTPEMAAQPVVVLVIPLLFEARMMDLVTEIWVVHCDREQQIERLMQRESPERASPSDIKSLPTQSAGRSYHLSRSQAEARISSQMPIEKKISRADIVLNNSSGVASLYQQIDESLKGLEP